MAPLAPRMMAAALGALLALQLAGCSGKGYDEYRKGLAAQKIKHYPEAITHYKAAIAQNPDLAAAYLHLGNCYARTEAMGEAEAAFQKSVAYYEAHRPLGRRQLPKWQRRVAWNYEYLARVELGRAEDAFEDDEEADAKAHKTKAEKYLAKATHIDSDNAEVKTLEERVQNAALEDLENLTGWEVDDDDDESDDP